MEKNDFCVPRNCHQTFSGSDINVLSRVGVGTDKFFKLHERVLRNTRRRNFRMVLSFSNMSLRVGVMCSVANQQVSFQKFPV